MTRFPPPEKPLLLALFLSAWLSGAMGGEVVWSNQLTRAKDLAWAARLGVKVALDLHSPPGGGVVSGYQA